MGRGLSRQQRDAVRRIGDELIRRKELRDQTDAESRSYRRLYGVECSADDQTESGWASWARTKRRLQQRGLIERRRFLGDWLTPAGWEVYREMTGRDVPAELIGSTHLTGP
jgi:hypothetical protein